MQIGVVVPLYLTNQLHVDFTREALASLTSQHHELKIYLLDNHHEASLADALQALAREFDATILDNPKGNSLSAAWNLGIEQAHADGAWHTIVINNDVVLHPRAVDHLVRFAEKHTEFVLVTGTEWSDLRTLNSADWDGSWAEHPHFSFFMVSPATIELVGYFDEQIDSAYFEDNDYHLRILLAGSKAAATTRAKFYHYGSRTVEVDDELKLAIKPKYEKNRQYLIDKWGIDFQTESYNPPERILERCYREPFGGK